jgi:hypothetical protein
VRAVLGACCQGWNSVLSEVNDAEQEDPLVTEHHTAVVPLDEGAVQARCTCGWRSPVFGTEKTGGAMDPLQQAADAADLHEWDTDLS